MEDSNPATLASEAIYDINIIRITDHKNFIFLVRYKSHEASEVV